MSINVFNVNPASHNLPSEYQEVEWIKGEIDTGEIIIPGDTEETWEYTCYAEYIPATIIATSVNGGYMQMLFTTQSGSQIVYFYFGFNNGNNSISSILNKKIIVRINKKALANDDTERCYYTFIDAETNETLISRYTYKPAGGTQAWIDARPKLYIKPALKTYGFKKIGGKELVPCYRKSDSTVGMYDITNNEFIAATGTTDKGNDIPKYKIQPVKMNLLKETNNLLKLTRTEWNSNSYQPTDTVTFDYNKLYYMAGSGYIRPKENSLNETITNNSVTFTATNSSWWGIGFPIKVKPNTKYTISLKRTDGNKTKPIYTIYNADGTFSRYSQVSTNTSLLDITDTITTGATETTLIIVIAGITQGDTVYAYDIQVEEGQTATAFKPYGYETKKYKIVFFQHDPLADTVLSLSAGSQTSATLNIYKTNTTATEIYLDDTLVTTSTTSGTQDISVTIPSGTSTLKISGGTFYFDSYCLGSTANNALLTDISYGNNYGNTIGSYAFNGCTGLTSITIPDSVTRIWDYAFWGCTGLTSLTIGSGVTYIGGFAFYGCTGLTGDLTIPSSVTVIADGAFRDCSSLTSITIPSTVTSIGNQVFYGCRGLTSITINATTPPTLGTSTFTYTNDCPIYVPSASVTDYQSANNWSSYSSRIQAIPV